MISTWCFFPHQTAQIVGLNQRYFMWITTLFYLYLSIFIYIYLYYLYLSPLIISLFKIKHPECSSLEPRARRHCISMPVHWRPIPKLPSRVNRNTAVPLVGGSQAECWRKAQDVKERYGYGSIPVHTIFRGMNIHLPAILMFTRGIGFWPIPICR